MGSGVNLRHGAKYGIMIPKHQKGAATLDIMEHIGPYTLRQRSELPRLGTDSLLLSQFVTLRPKDRVLDLGCGVGVLAVLLAQRAQGLTLDGVELHPVAAALAEENLRENDLSGTILHQDLREKGWFSQGHYDLIVTNPPYFSAGSGMTATRQPAAARAELTCTIEDLCRAAAPRLKTGGRFGLVCRTERLTDWMVALRAHNLEPKRLQLMQTTPQKPPKLFLLEAVRQGKPGLRVEPVWMKG